MPYSNKKIAHFSILLAAALAIWIFEEFLPRPMPWLKPGFSYIAVLLAMRRFGIGAGALLALLRVTLGALLLGKIFSPAFILSICGTTTAVATMAIMFLFYEKAFSLVGISVAGAFCHIFAQILTAGALFYRIDAILWLLPVSALWTVFAGAIVGLIAKRLSIIKIFRHDMHKIACN